MEKFNYKIEKSSKFHYQEISLIENGYLIEKTFKRREKTKNSVIDEKHNKVLTSQLCILSMKFFNIDKMFKIFCR